MNRRIVWFSCGAASAVTAWVASQIYRDDLMVVYCDTHKSEEPDNERFFYDVQGWIGKSIEVIRSDKYETIDDVFMKTRYMAGVQGARCTVELKKIPRFEFQQPDDIHLFGFTADEKKRTEEFTKRNPELFLEWILIERGIKKSDCFRLLEKANIELPRMYRLGYKNNNCIGCVKASSARYWNMIRRDYSDVFTRRCQQSRELGVRLTRIKGARIFLDELPPDYMADKLENISCGPECS